MRNTRTLTTALLLAATVIISGCTAPAPSDTEPPTDPTPTPSLNNNFDRDDPCTLLTVDELAAAMGLEPASVEETGTHTLDTHRPHCEWTFDDASVHTLDIRPVEENNVYLSVELVHFEAPPACFGLPCATASDYLHAWATDRYNALTDRTPHFEYRIVDSPHILSGAAAVFTQGVTFVDDVTYAHFIIYRCGSDACADAIVGIQEAMGKKLS